MRQDLFRCAAGVIAPIFSEIPRSVPQRLRTAVGDCGQCMAQECVFRIHAREATRVVPSASKLGTMDAKSRAWQRLQAELKQPQTDSAPAPVKVDPRKETLLERFQRMAKQPLSKPQPEAA